MKTALRLLCLLCAVSAGSAFAQTPLADARRGFATHLIFKENGGQPPPVPPAGVFELVRYTSPAGQLPAYFTVPPKDGKKHPAILWLTGGFGNDIDEGAWTPGPADNDQSATAFREAGILMLYPSLRGGNGNPGQNENFFGEVDDVLAARDWLARQPSVDPDRIYLGGHSTGGTLALLVSECTGGLRGVFAFGPVYGPRGYGEGHLFYDLSNPKETELRAPYRWLKGITSPTFVFEGTEAPGNIAALRALEKSAHGDAVHFYPATGVTHFSILRPMTRLIARKIVADAGPTTNVAFTTEEVDRTVAGK